MAAPLSFDITVRDFNYHVEITDQREMRKLRKQRGYSGRDLPAPWHYEAQNTDNSLILRNEWLHYFSVDDYAKPTKKEIMLHIETEFRRYDAKQREIAEKKKIEEEKQRQREEQHLAHERWCAEPANITNGDLEKLKSRIQSLESKLNNLVAVIDEMDSSVRGLGYRIYGPGLEE